MIRLFTGFDQREAVGWHAFVQSVKENASQAVAVTALSGNRHDGSNSFTYSRFEVPALCQMDGWAIFADGSDMICKADISELWAMRDDKYAVQVVKHKYETKHPIKYRGTPMECHNEDYPLKNWSSLILWNCAHKANMGMLARDMTKGTMHRFPWLTDDLIGELPMEWNWLADEYGKNDKAKLLHWTAGIPAFNEYADAPHADDWYRYATRCADGSQ